MSAFFTGLFVVLIISIVVVVWLLWRSDVFKVDD
jgi:hypothetical protein